jgi:hypothetical protein
MIPNGNREKAIRHLEAYCTDLQTQIKQQKVEFDRAMQSLKLLRENTNPSLLEAPAQESSYADLGPQEAVNQFLRAHPGQAFKPSALAKGLRAHGYEPTSDDPNTFVAMVRTGCIRLRDKGVLRQTDIDGKIAFVFPSEGVAT